jgi:hypothetical protein
VRILARPDQGRSDVQLRGDIRGKMMMTRIAQALYVSDGDPAPVLDQRPGQIRGQLRIEEQFSDSERRI